MEEHERWTLAQLMGRILYLLMTIRSSKDALDPCGILSFKYTTLFPELFIKVMFETEGLCWQLLLGRLAAVHGAETLLQQDHQLKASFLRGEVIERGFWDMSFFYCNV